MLARLDTSRLTPQAAQAAAQVAAQEQAVDKLEHGNRPEEIAQARANLASAAADADDARTKYDRLTALAQSSAGRALSRQDLDDARSAAQMAAARLAVNQQALAPRADRPAPGGHRPGRGPAAGRRAQLALLQQQLADAELVAPDGRASSARG